MKGKDRCKILKEIREAIAKENDIAIVTAECKHKGDCLGTCPACEAEVRYLERELEKRQKLGKAVAIAGLTAAITVSMAACESEKAGSLMQPESFGSADSRVETTVGELPPPLFGGELPYLNYSIEDIQNMSEENILLFLQQYHREWVCEQWNDAYVGSEENTDRFLLDAQGRILYVRYLSNGVAERVWFLNSLDDPCGVPPPLEEMKGMTVQEIEQYLDGVTRGVLQNVWANALVDKQEDYDCFFLSDQNNLEVFYNADGIVEHVDIQEKALVFEEPLPR